MADIKKLGFSYEIHTDGTKDPISSSCTYCTHVAKRLQAKVDSLKAAYRHVPKKLLRDLEIANITKDDHTTRDKDRIVTCPRLLAHRCELCGKYGHTRSRCVDCSYCGKHGHIANECPKQLADDRARGWTMVLKGITPKIMAKLSPIITELAMVDD